MGVLLSNDKYDYSGYKCPRCDEITELVVSKKINVKKINAITNYKKIINSSVAKLNSTLKRKIQL